LRGFRGGPPGKKRLQRKGGVMSILWIILIIVLVLALLGFFGRSYW
jgi:flagellar basal body-associated protein FliL